MEPSGCPHRPCARSVCERTDPCVRVSAAPGRIRCFIVPLPQKALHKTEGKASGERAVHNQSHDHADGGVEDAVQGIADVVFHRCVEQNNTQHHAAGLDAPHPEDLAQQNQHHSAHKYQGHQQERVPALWAEDQVDPEERHAQKPADDRTKEAVAAMELGAFQVAAHAKNGANAGEGGAAVQKIIEQRAQSGGQSRFDVAHADFGKAAKRLAGFVHKNDPSLRADLKGPRICDQYTMAMPG